MVGGPPVVGLYFQNRWLGDFFDPNSGVFLSVTRTTLAIFTTTELLNEDFVAFGLVQDLRGNTGTAHFGRPQPEITFTANRQNPVERNFVAGIGVSKIDL